LKGTGGSQATISKEEPRVWLWRQMTELNSRLGESTALNLLASFYGLCRNPRHRNRKGNDTVIQERVKAADATLTTEKMLSANNEMSNIFLQRGQNIDIACKNLSCPFINFRKAEGISGLFTLTKRSALSGLNSCLSHLSCPFYGLQT
jgi:hypothetical protein